MKIVNAPANILTTPVKLVTQFDARLKKIVDEMKVTLESQSDPIGVGLAANQVGLDMALFIIKPEKESIPQVFVNAKIVNSIQYSVFSIQEKTKKSRGKQNTKLEGCLSIPRIWGKVQRNPKIKVNYQDLDGKKYNSWFSGFTAVIIQHEIDHLNGVLFTQRVLEQNQKLYKEEDGELKEISI